jgi:hypothetical protein
LVLLVLTAGSELVDPDGMLAASGRLDELGTELIGWVLPMMHET